MMVESEILCIPKGDTKKRFLLGKNGHKNLLCVGLNPSTADEKGLDPTSRNIEVIAQKHGYDGWLLVNLYPQRASHPTDLASEKDEELFWQNLKLIDALIIKKQFVIPRVLLAWGNNIDSFSATYLKEAVYYLYKMLEKHVLPYCAIGVTNAGHPYHPSPQPVNTQLGGIDKTELQEFDYKTYAGRIREQLSLPTEIIYRGIH